VVLRATSISTPAERVVSSIKMILFPVALKALGISCQPTFDLLHRGSDVWKPADLACRQAVTYAMQYNNINTRCRAKRDVTQSSAACPLSHSVARDP